MINKKSTVGKHKNIPVANFGYGTVQMILAEQGEGQWLLLKNQEPHEIGSTKIHGFNDADEMKPDMCLVFKNIESLDAIISQLKEMRTRFLDTEK